MMKLFLAFVLSFAMMFCAQAQPKQLIIKKGSRGLYLEHTVVPKEGLYSIGRLYNVNPKFIADYNQVDIIKGLNVDQVIHIPLTDTNFTQKSNKGTPVYYAVIENQGLMKVSNAINKVTLKELRSWNAIKNDNLSAGSKLIVGFLVSKEMSALASKAPVKQTPVKQEDEPVIKTVQSEDKTVVKTETAKAIIPEVKEEPKKTEPVFAKQEAATTSSEQGYFKGSFDQQVKGNPASKNTTVTSGIFKTTSGWQDAKYYLLMDDVATGTIVKVINPGNNKTVYAKVLGEMNGIRQNQGLNIRISNAASTALGVTDTEKFIVMLNY